MSIAAIVIGLSGLVLSIITFAVGVVTGAMLTRSCLTKSTATLNDADMYEDMGGAGAGGVVGGAGAGVGGVVGGAGVTNGPAVYEDMGGAGVVGGAGAGVGGVVGGAGAGVGVAGVTNGLAVYEDVSLHPLEGLTNDIMLTPNDAYGHTRGIF